MTLLGQILELRARSRTSAAIRSLIGLAPKVEALQQQGNVVAMAGDGINDAPRAGQGRRRHRNGYQHRHRHRQCPHHPRQWRLAGHRARALSIETVRNMWQNIGFALVYSALGIPLAAGVLYPVTGTLLSPRIAALAMSLNSVSVIANALRPRKR